MPSIEIAHRFNGPPNSGNGGYVCGCTAAFVAGAARVRLMQPPPLGVPLNIASDADGVTVTANGNDIARAVPATLDLAVPDAPSADEVSRCEQRFRGHTEHAFPGCFVCGPAREPGDGLRLFTGPRDTSSREVAAHWVPDASLSSDGQTIDPAFLWSALDCPGAYSFTPAAGKGVVLGELTAEIAGAVRIGEPLRVTGWHIASDGRKHDTGTALFRADGEVIARAKGRWFEIDPAAFS